MLMSIYLPEIGASYNRRPGRTSVPVIPIPDTADRAVISLCNRRYTAGDGSLDYSSVNYLRTGLDPLSRTDTTTAKVCSL